MTTVAWFHCFAGIAGDMALGACLDAGARPRRGDRHPRAAPGRGLGARDRARHAGRAGRHPGPRKAKPDGITRTYGAHRRAHRGGPPARPGPGTGPAGVPAPGRDRGPAAPPAHRLGPLPRGRAASTPSSTSSAPAPRSRPSASTRCRRRPCGGDGHGPHQPRPAAQPVAGDRRPAQGRARGRPRHQRRAHHPDRRRPPRRAVLRLRAAAADAPALQRLRRRHQGARLAAQPRPDRRGRAGVDRRPAAGPAARAPRGEPRRRQRRSRGPRRRCRSWPPAPSTPGPPTSP